MNGCALTSAELDHRFKEARGLNIRFSPKNYIRKFVVRSLLLPNFIFSSILNRKKTIVFHRSVKVLLPTKIQQQKTPNVSSILLDVTSAGISENLIVTDKN